MMSPVRVGDCWRWFLLSDADGRRGAAGQDPQSDDGRHLESGSADDPLHVCAADRLPALRGAVAA